MLDAFIIEKIQREDELRDSAGQPLRIEISREKVRETEGRVDNSDEADRGIAIIDFNI